LRYPRSPPCLAYVSGGLRVAALFAGELRRPLLL